MWALFCFFFPISQSIEGYIQILKSAAIAIICYPKLTLFQKMKSDSHFIYSN